MRGIKLLKVLPVFILLLLITGGADNRSQLSNNVLNPYNGKGLHAVILTDDNKENSTRKWDGEYYTAMLHLKMKYPAEKYDVHIYNKEEKPGLIRFLNVKKYPTIVLIKNNQAISVISGPNHWKTIYKKMSGIVGTPSS